jgi:hypothetical protein
MITGWEDLEQDEAEEILKVRNYKNQLEQIQKILAEDK